MADTIRIYDGAFGQTLTLTKQQAVQLYYSLQKTPYAKSYITEYLNAYILGTLFRGNLTVTPTDLVFLNTVMGDKTGAL